jgi:hypothetical protein
MVGQFSMPIDNASLGYETNRPVESSIRRCWRKKIASQLIFLFQCYGMMLGEWSFDAGRLPESGLP